MTPEAGQRVREAAVSGTPRGMRVSGAGDSGVVGAGGHVNGSLESRSGDEKHRRSAKWTNSVLVRKLHFLRSQTYRASEFGLSASRHATAARSPRQNLARPRDLPWNGARVTTIRDWALGPNPILGCRRARERSPHLWSQREPRRAWRVVIVNSIAPNLTSP